MAFFLSRIALLEVFLFSCLGVSVRDRTTLYPQRETVDH